MPHDPLAPARLAKEELLALELDDPLASERLSLIIRRYAESLLPSFAFSAMTAEELHERHKQLPAKIQPLIEACLELDKHKYRPAGDSPSGPVETVREKVLRLITP